MTTITLRIAIFLHLLLFSFHITKAQSDTQTKLTELNFQANSHWLDKSYSPIEPILQEMLDLAESSENDIWIIESLIQLHEYEAFHNHNNVLALEYIIRAMDFADKKEINELRLKTRSKLMYFHQATTQDESLVGEVLVEMKSINQWIDSEFYDNVIAQWEAQIIGTKRLIGLPITKEETENAISIVNKTIQYFDAENPEHLFYYQQTRRIIVGFFGDRYGFEKCMEHLESIKQIESKMKDPVTPAANLIFEGSFHSAAKNHQEVISILNQGSAKMNAANPGLKRYFHQLLADANQNISDLENAILHLTKMQEYDKEVNKLAFANKVESIRHEQESIATSSKNNVLSNQNRNILIIAILLLIGLVGSLISWRRIKHQNTIIDNQKTDLQEINSVKNKLFGILAHDLRSPVSYLNNLSKKLNYLSQKGDQDSINTLTTEIHERTNNLEKMLDEILPWMAVQMKNKQLNIKNHNLGSILINIKGEQKGLTASKKIMTTISGVDTSALVDEDALRIVLRNLYVNAIKFSAADSTIIISSEKINNHQTAIKIKDHGIGIDEFALNNAFTEYHSTPGTEGEKGHGLGLKLSKDLVVAMNGTLHLESTKGSGTTAIITLPSS